MIVLKGNEISLNLGFFFFISGDIILVNVVMLFVYVVVFVEKIVWRVDRCFWIDNL